MLRAFHRILRAGGSIAGYIIHASPGLTGSDELRAAELGPPEVGASASPTEMACSVGFSIVEDRDVTETFSSTCEAILCSRGELEDELRRAEGDDTFEEEQAKKSHMLTGIGEGLLRRSLVIAMKT